LELCGPGDGGLTPTIEVLNSVLSNLKIPTHVMIRPRSGDFCYSDAEYNQMLESVKQVKETGAAGVVFGILNPDKTIDFPRMKTLVELSRPMRVVCHKAFDETPNSDQALDTLI
jgi:copper homeostasis protein